MAFWPLPILVANVGNEYRAGQKPYDHAPYLVASQQINPIEHIFSLLN
jgi:hypothetical protein